MTATAERLDQCLRVWNPDRAAQVERLVNEIIDWAEADSEDLMRSRTVEQEVLDQLDES